MKIPKIIKPLTIAAGLFLAANSFAQSDAPQTVNTQLKEKNVSYVEAPRVQKTKKISEKKTKEELTPFQINLNKLSDKAKADMSGLTEGSKAIIIQDNDGDNAVDVTPVDAVKLYAGDKNPKDYIWVINQQDPTSDQIQRNVLYFDETKNVLFNPNDKKEFKFGSEFAYQLMTDTVLKRLNKSQKDELKLTVDKNVILQNKLQAIFFNKNYYTGTDKARPQVDVEKYDGCYVVFNENLRVGGKNAYYAQVKPFYFIGGNIVRDDDATRNLDITEVKDLESILSNLQKQKQTAGSIYQTRAGIDYAGTASTLSIPTKNGKGVIIGTHKQTDSFNAVNADFDSRINLPKAIYADVDGKVAYVFDSNQVTVKALSSLGYNKKNVGVSAGLAVLADKYDDKEFGKGSELLLGPGVKAIFMPNSTLELEAIYNMMNGTAKSGDFEDNSASYKEAMLRARQNLGKFVLDAQGKYTQSNQFGTETKHADLDLKGAWYFNPHLGLYIKGGAGTLIDGPADIKENTVRYGAGLEYKLHK